MTYATTERARAAAWKAHTKTLPDEARVPAQYLGRRGATAAGYAFCLPAPFADHNLLPEVRAEALALFAELAIPWHAGVQGGPSNHLLSSQVQCVNALTQMVEDADRLRLAFGDALDLGELLEIEPRRFLTFEYIGPTDFFGEAPRGERVRGAQCTSVDAAFLHRAPDGLRELVLVEWKYTESYRQRRPDPERDVVRHGRYAEAVADPAGPVRGDLLTFEHLLDEPFYQLVRQQLLAHALEQAGEADRVRVVLVVPPANDEYQLSLARPEQRALGDSVSEVWQRLLRRLDRFTTLSPEAFLAPSVTSTEYVLRYAPDVVWDQAGLLAALAVDDPYDVDDSLDFEGDVVLSEDEIELRIGCFGTVLSYPFRLEDVHDVVDELETRWEDDSEF